MMEERKNKTRIKSPNTNEEQNEIVEKYYEIEIPQQRFDDFCQQVHEENYRKTRQWEQRTYCSRKS